MKLLHLSVGIARETGRCDAPVANASFLVCGFRAQLHWPQRPWSLWSTLIRRFRHDFKLVNGNRFLPMTSSEAVSASVSTTDDDNVLAGRKNIESGIENIATAALVLLRQEFHREVDSLQFPARNFEIARLLSATRKNDGVKVASQIFDQYVSADLGIGDELHSFCGHLFKTAVDNMLLEFKFGNSVAKQSANLISLFVDRNIVSGTTKLLGSGQSSGTGADDCNRFPAPIFRRSRTDPALEKSSLDDVLLILLNRDRWLSDTQHARSLTRSRTNASGKLREIVGGVQLTHGFFPIPTINVVVPIRNEIVDRTTGLTERHTAIHAARALFAELVFRKVLIDFEPVVHALDNRPARSLFAVVIHEACRLTHVAPALHQRMREWARQEYTRAHFVQRRALA